MLLLRAATIGDTATIDSILANPPGRLRRSCHRSELAGTTLNIGRFSGEPIVIEDWDGQSFELQ